MTHFSFAQVLKGALTGQKHWTEQWPEREPKAAQQLLQPPPATAADDLTGRQIEVLVLIAQGLSAKEAGHKLGLSPKTIDVHRSRIMERLRVHDIASLTRYAMRMGLVTA